MNQEDEMFPDGLSLDDQLSAVEAALKKRICCLTDKDIKGRPSATSHRSRAKEIVADHERRAKRARIAALMAAAKQIDEELGENYLGADWL